MTEKLFLILLLSISTIVGAVGHMVIRNSFIATVLSAALSLWIYLTIGAISRGDSLPDVVYGIAVIFGGLVALAISFVIGLIFKTKVLKWSDTKKGLIIISIGASLFSGFYFVERIKINQAVSKIKIIKITMTTSIDTTYMPGSLDNLNVFY